MIKGLTGAGIGNPGTLEQFVTLAARHGFGAVDTDGAEIQRLLDDKGIEETRRFLAAQGIRIGAIGLSVEWRQSEEQFLEGLETLVRDAKAAAAVGCAACCTYVLPSTDENAARFMALATRRLRLIAQLLGAFGIRLGLEFVGPHHLRTAWKHPLIWDMPGMLDWISAIGEPNVGLLFDSLHWHTTYGSYEDILRLRPEQIIHVHINDARAVPIPEVLDNDRLYPGEGAIDLVSFLKGLKTIGYKGVIAQEILSQELSSATPEDLAARSAAAFARVFAKAGI